MDYEDLIGTLVEMSGATARLASNCAVALSEAGLLHEVRASACAKEMRTIGRLIDEARIDVDAPPSALAGQLQALAQILEDQSKR